MWLLELGHDQVDMALLGPWLQRMALQRLDSKKQGRLTYFPAASPLVSEWL